MSRLDRLIVRWSDRLWAWLVRTGWAGTPEQDARWGAVDRELEEKGQ